MALATWEFSTSLYDRYVPWPQPTGRSSQTGSIGAWKQPCYRALTAAALANCRRCLAGLLPEIAWARMTQHLVNPPPLTPGNSLSQIASNQLSAGI
jgi:hypothetical protein